MYSKRMPLPSSLVVWLEGPSPPLLRQLFVSLISRIRGTSVCEIKSHIDVDYFESSSLVSEI